MTNRLLVSFSGGKTSGYMSHELKRHYSHLYELRFVFANTGQELEETLVFVDQCDREFGLGVVWVEAVVSPIHGEGIRHKVVDFTTAARNGEPFEDFIRKSGIPNANKPQCSDRLKALPIESYKKSIGWVGCKHAIGIRVDESHRRSGQSAKYNLVYPMLDLFPSDKQDVTAFWETQPFTLPIEAHEGNCKTCWKKSDRKLYLLALEHPERFSFMHRCESTYAQVKPNNNGTPRTFFRRHRTVVDIINAAKEFSPQQLRRLIYKQGAQDDAGDGCTESCEAYTTELGVAQ